MRYHVLACDYDGTIALNGTVDDGTLASLTRLRQSGRRLVLVTGRELDDLFRVFPHTEMFDRVVAENGALLYRPESREEVALGESPNTEFVKMLRERNISPLSVGRVIVATWEPNETAVLESIRNLGLELQVIFNKGAVMVLPSGINKATGLAAALAELGLSPHNAIGVGDAENDHAFLSLCECSVAVANALPLLKDRADLVTKLDHGAGVAELIDGLVATDLEELAPKLRRHNILLGRTDGGRKVTVEPYGESILVTGTSGGGKSTLVTGLLERIGEQGYQYCIIDPEGDYENFEGAVVMGDAQRSPGVDEVMDLLGKPDQNAVVNLLGVRLEDRPSFFEGFLPRLQELRARTGRPHWIVVDEAHHLMPTSWNRVPLTLPKEFHGMILITVHPDHVSPTVLSAVNTIIAIGESPDKQIKAVVETLGETVPVIPQVKLEPGEGVMWMRSTEREPVVFRSVPPKSERRRHQRKYAEGELGEDRSFYFQGPEGKLNLRAQNLGLFIQIAAGIDDETWLYHLRQGDYSRWFREAIKDEELAREAQMIEKIEKSRSLPASESRSLIEDAINKRYTAPA
jgi:HAD superfamily hydrolase (TIGR01484 family)